MKMHIPPGEQWSKDYQRAHYLTSLEHTPVRRTAVDCGAHIGIWTLRYAHDFSTVWAIEPINHEYLKRNTQHLANVRVVEAALGNKQGTAYMKRIDCDNPSGAWELTEENTPHTTPVVTVDSLGLEDVDIIKIDTQGVERCVLEGADNTIRTYKPTIHIETRDGDLLKWIAHTYDYKHIATHIKDHVLIHRSNSSNKEQ